MAFPHEFTFVFILYFIGTILSEKSCRKWGVWKEYKKGGLPYRGWGGGVYSMGASNLLHTDIERLNGGALES